MVRTEIPTTYANIQIDDTIYINGQAQLVTAYSSGANGYRYITIKGSDGSRNVIAPHRNDLVQRAARA